MLQVISRRVSVNVLLIIFSLVILFHLLVITGIIPFDMVWGGRLKSHEEMIQFEAVSIFLNIIMLALAAIYGGYLKVKVKPIVLNIAMWIMFVIFALNTIGNIFSNNQMEKIIFTPVTLLLSLCCLRLVITKE